MPPAVLVVLGGDAGGGLLAEPDVDAEGGQVPVAGLGLQFGGAAAFGGQMGQPGVAQLVEGVPGAVRVVGPGRLLEQVLGARAGQPACPVSGQMSPKADARRPAAAARRSARNTGPTVRPASSRGRSRVPADSITRSWCWSRVPTYTDHQFRYYVDGNSGGHYAFTSGGGRDSIRFR